MPTHRESTPAPARSQGSPRRALPGALAGALLLAAVLPPPQAEAGRLVLLAAGQTLSAYSVPPEFVAGGGDPAAATFPTSQVQTDELSPAFQEIFSVPLLGAASEIALFPGRADSFVVTTERGLYLCRFGVDPSAKTPELQLLLGGSDLVGAEIAADGQIYTLERPSPRQEGGSEPHELFVLRPGAYDDPVHLGYTSPESSNLYLAPGDSLLWIPRRLGRTLDRAIRRQGAWSIAEVAIPEGSQHTEDQFWALNVILPRAQGGPLLIEQARGLPPRLSALEPSGKTRTVAEWNRWISAKGTAIDAKGDELAVDGSRTVIVRYLPDSRDTWIRTQPVRAIALSADGRLLALAAATAKDRTRLETLRIAGGTALRSEDLPQDVRALAFFEIDR
jgi:hypothetical protein